MFDNNRIIKYTMIGIKEMYAGVVCHEIFGKIPETTAITDLDSHKVTYRIQNYPLFSIEVNTDEDSLLSYYLKAGDETFICPIDTSWTECENVVDAIVESLSRIIKDFKQSIDNKK